MSRARQLSCALGLACLVVSAPADAQEERLGTTELATLAEVRDAFARNTASLRTWRGELKSERETVLSQAPAADLPANWPEQEVVAFVIDAEAGNSRSHITRTGPLHVRDSKGKVTIRNDDRVSAELRKGADMYVLDLAGPFAHTSGKSKRVRVGEAPRPRKRTRGEEDSDPRQLYLRPNRVDLQELLDGLVKSDGVVRIRPTVMRQGDVVTLEYQAGRSVNRYRFDLARGGNLTEYLASTQNPDRPPIKTEIRIDYDTVDGVVVPTSISQVSETYSGETTIKTTRNMKVTTSAVNRPVDPAEFSLEAMGVRPGDRVVDNRAGLLYQYQPGLTPSAVNASLETAEAARGSVPAVADGAVPVAAAPVKAEGEWREPGRSGVARRTWAGFGVLLLAGAIAFAAAALWRRKGRRGPGAPHVGN